MIFAKRYYFDSLDSTNDYIKANIDKLQNGDVVMANSQSKGRGRFANAWMSEKGNLYFSFLIKENLDRDEIFPIIMRAAVAVREVLDEFHLYSKIKYPNDILVENKKICGILAETIGYEHIEALVVGIGINLNQTDFHSLAEKATSIFLETKIKTNVEQVLNDYLSKYEKLSDPSKVHQKYHNNLFFPEKMIKIDGIDYTISHVKNNGQIVVSNGAIAKSVDYSDFSFNSNS